MSIHVGYALFFRASSAGCARGVCSDGPLCGRCACLGLFGLRPASMDRSTY